MQPVAGVDLPASFRFLAAYFLLWQSLAARAAEDLERQLNLDVRDLILLSYLAWGHDNTPTGLARRMQLSKFTVTRALNHLSSLGAIDRAAHPDDGRRARLSLTPAGRELHAAAIARIEATLGPTLEPLTEVPELVGRLEALVNRLKGPSA